PRSRASLFPYTTLFRSLVFAGHRLFKASCKDSSIQKIPVAERWAMAVGAPYAIAGNNHWARRVVNDDSVEAENDCKNEVESLAEDRKSTRLNSSHVSIS